MFSDKQIIFCRGTCVANVYRSLAAFAELISRNQYLAQHLIFLLHVCPQDVPVKSLESVPELARQINHIYGTTDSVPVHFYHQEIDKEEQLSLMMAADLGLFLGSNPSTNIIAQEFMQLHSDNNSPLILSSNSNLLSMLPNWSFPTLNDTDSITTIANTLHTALTSPKSSKCSTYEVISM
jgi:trehalose-6-phosphate synthase